MIDVSEFTTQLAYRCAVWADWRKGIVDEFPFDKRNAFAVERLSAQADELLSAEDSPLHRRLAELWNRLPAHFKTGDRNVIDEHMRLIGFYAHPDDAHELVAWIIRNFEPIAE